MEPLDDTADEAALRLEIDRMRILQRCYIEQDLRFHIGPSSDWPTQFVTATATIAEIVQTHTRRLRRYGAGYGHEDMVRSGLDNLVKSVEVFGASVEDSILVEIAVSATQQLEMLDALNGQPAGRA